jgi:hypothetical protein
LAPHFRVFVQIQAKNPITSRNGPSISGKTCANCQTGLAKFTKKVYSKGIPLVEVEVRLA